MKLFVLLCLLLVSFESFSLPRIEKNLKGPWQSIRFNSIKKYQVRYPNSRNLGDPLADKATGTLLKNRDQHLLGNLFYQGLQSTQGVAALCLELLATFG